MNKKKICAAAVAVFGFFPFQHLFAFPATINLQGRLTDPTGNPISRQTQVDFNLYQGGSPNIADDGVVVYKERSVITPGPDGVYEHKLGEGTPLEGHTLTPSDFMTDQPVYLQLVIGGSALLPRIQLAANSYSFVSNIAETVKTGSIKRESLDVPSFQSNGEGIVPQGAILIFLTSCPAGYSEVKELQQRYPLGADTTGASALVPDAPNIAAGSLGHSHNIAHTHQTGGPTISGQTEEIGTGDAYAYFSQPMMINGVAALGSGDQVWLKGVVPSFPTTTQSPLTSGVTETLPPSLTVMFCKKN